MMKILYVGLARSIWLFDVRMLNPEGLTIQPIFDALRERYQFAQYPKNALDLDDQKGFSFKAGSFTNSKGISVVVGFTVYSDGWIADALSSTDDATEFLVEISSWLRREYGFEVPNIRKAFLSQIDFESALRLSMLNPHMEKFSQLLAARYRPADGKERRFDAAGLSYWTEDLGQPLAPAPFKFERKIGAPFASDHYFSQAPLETQPHIDLLNELVEMLQTPYMRG